jgi:hypothetical protein
MSILITDTVLSMVESEVVLNAASANGRISKTLACFERVNF